MGRISQITYGVISDDVMSQRDAAAFYFYDNMMQMSRKFMDEYEIHEESQHRLMQSELKKLMNDDEVTSHPRGSQVVLGLSSMKGQCVILSEI